MPLKLSKRGGVYYARGTIAGQRIYQSTGCRKRAEADAWAARTEAQLRERHALGINATLTFAEAALTYMQAGGEGRFLRPILEYFGPDFRLADMNNAALNAAAEAILPEAAPATINRNLITPVRAVVNLAVEEGLATPVKFRKRREPPARTRWLRPAEAEALIHHAGDHLVPILAALIGSGARVSEILEARASNFHPDTGEVWLENTKSDFPRMVRLPGRARDLILEARPPAGGALLRRPDGGAYSTGRGATPISNAFNRARDKAGLGRDVTPHILRHTWATWYYAQTRDFAGLLDLGGWRVADMAMRYRKAAPEGLADQLLAAGWDFTRLGRAIPAPAVASGPRLRVVPG